MSVSVLEVDIVMFFGDKKHFNKISIQFVRRQKEFVWNSSWLHRHKLKTCFGKIKRLRVYKIVKTFYRKSTYSKNFTLSLNIRFRKSSKF